MNPAEIDNRYYELLQQIQAVDFVLVELNLYLDTHKEDHNAIQQFNQHVGERWRLVQEFESCYGPLLGFGRSFSGFPWQWSDTPWPWQV